MAIPLVTLTLTTEEMAMTSAGVMLLRKFWAKRYLDGDVSGGTIIQNCTDFLTRLESEITPEQGRNLLNELIRKNQST